MSRLRGIALLIALSGLLARGCATVNSDPVQVCAWKGKALTGGACPTLCSWQCDVAERDGCNLDACTERCDLARQDFTASCLDATYAEWICLERQSVVHATCAEEQARVTFVAESPCTAEHRAASDACHTDAPLALPRSTPLCEWQCQLADAENCGSADCQRACEKRDQSATGGCRDAAQTLWTCMAEGKRVAPVCCAGRIEFPIEQGACSAEREAVAESCGDVDPLTIRLRVDAGSTGDAPCADPTPPKR